MSIADRRVAAWLFIVTFVAYAYFHAGGGWNQNAQFDLTRAIVEDHTLSIDGLESNTGDLSRFEGHWYPNKAPGISLLAVLPYLPLHAIEQARGLDPNDPIALALAHYLCTMVTIALLGALVPMLLYRAARERDVDAVWAATVALIVALATQLFPYSTMLVANAPSASLVFIALFFALRRTSGALAISGLAAGLAALTNYLCIPVAAIIGLLVVVRSRERMRAIAMYAAGAMPPLILLAIYQRLTCGGFLTTPMSTMDQRFVDQHAILGIIQLPSSDALWGITLSPYRGVFYFAPVLLAGIAALFVWLRDRDELQLLLCIVAISAVFFTFNVTFNGWEGGFGIGGRYLLPAIPLLGLALLRLRGAWRIVTIALAIPSLVFNFAATAVDPQPSGTIPRPLTQYVLPLLLHGEFSPNVPITPPWSAATFTGHTSVNRLTHDEAIVFSRHPPGSAVAEWTSFNLGEPFFGPGDARSLIPIVLALLAGIIGIIAATTKIDRRHAL